MDSSAVKPNIVFESVALEYNLFRMDVFQQNATLSGELTFELVVEFEAVVIIHEADCGVRVLCF